MEHLLTSFMEENQKYGSSFIKKIKKQRKIAEIFTYAYVSHLILILLWVYFLVFIYLFITFSIFFCLCLYLMIDRQSWTCKNFCDLLVLQRTLSSLELPRAVSGASGQSTSIAVGESPLDESQERSSGNVRDGRLSISQYNGRPRQKPQDPARDLSIHVLEKFSLVTKFARETTSQIFGEAHSNGFGAIEKRRYDESSIDHPRNSSNSAEKVPDEIPVASDPLEVTLFFI